jgi:predicted PurR-regulated permease PerM
MNAPAPRRPSSRREGSPANARGLILFAFGLLAVTAVTVLTARVLLAVFAGMLFAIVLRAVGSFIARHLHVPYGVILALLVILSIGGAVLAVVLAIPRVGDEIEGLRTALPPAVHRLASSFGYGDVLERHLGGQKLENPQLDKLLRGAIATVGTGFDVLVGLVVCFFVAVYGAADPDVYASAVRAVVPARHRPLADAIMKEATRELGRWLLGRLVAMTFVAITTGIAFVLLKVPLAIPLALLSGLLTFVEYVGAVTAAIPAVLLAFSQGPLSALWVALTYTGLHVVEGYVLTPLLARNAVRMPPALTLVGQALFGVLVGSLGLTFSTPLLVVAISAGKEWRRRSGRVEREATPSVT